MVSILDELRPEFELFTPGDGGWTRGQVAGLPEIGVVDISPLDMFDEESNGEALVSLQDPVTPPSLLLVDLEPAVPAAPTLLKRSPANFDATGLVVSRHEAISIDGERIPYVQVGPRDATGDAFVHMSGYGGFGVSEEPYYNTAIGKLWLERGGVSVVANHPRRRRIRHALARRGPARKEAALPRRFRRGRGRSRRARRRRRRSISPPRAARTAAS